MRECFGDTFKRGLHRFKSANAGKFQFALNHGHGGNVRRDDRQRLAARGQKFQRQSNGAERIANPTHAWPDHAAVAFAANHTCRIFHGRNNIGLANRASMDVASRKFFGD